MQPTPLDPANPTAGFDPLPQLRALADSIQPSARFTPRTPDEARAWQTRVRAELARCIGFLDQAKVPLDPVVEPDVDRGTYIRRRVVLRTSPYTRMPLYLLIPKNAPRPLPCVLAFNGHGYGVKDIVGLWEDGSERLHPDGYHRDFACALANHGFLVLAPEISCFGERQGHYSFDRPSPVPSTCHNLATFAIMLGGSALGLRVWDALRAVDYLATLPEADSKRLGAMGISGGGMHAFFSTALDPRIQACVISGYFCNWRHSILAMHHCSCNFVPGLLRLGELSDLAALIAPRPCLIENATHDELFPLPQVQATIAQARPAWDLFHASHLLQSDFFEGRHRINAARAYTFLQEALKT